MHTFMLFRGQLMTTDQAHKFLRMHFMAVTITGILLWHRARSAAIDHVFLLRPRPDRLHD